MQYHKTVSNGFQGMAFPTHRIVLIGVAVSAPTAFPTAVYDTGHIPDAVHIDWRADLQDPVIRDYISPEKFARLFSRHGITPDTTCIFYGDA
jgi:3-mercaptopyruvate sulfurtransferase SseA